MDEGKWHAANDPYGIHEALHMAHVCGEMVGNYLRDHPAVDARPEIAVMVDRAIEALGEAYQALGREDF